jgi:aspartate racemase
MICQDLQETERMVAEGDWPALTQRLMSAAGQLVQAGAEGLLLCSFSLHCFAPEIAESIPVPLLHIVDVLAGEIGHDGRRVRLGVLGPSEALVAGSLRERLTRGGRIRIVTPPTAEARRLDAMIFGQLSQGFSRPGAREELKGIIAGLRRQRVGTLVLTCPELAELLTPEDYVPTLFHAPEIHAVAAADWMLAPAGPARRRRGRPPRFRTQALPLNFHEPTARPA